MNVNSRYALHYVPPKRGKIIQEKLDAWLDKNWVKLVLMVVLVVLIIAGVRQNTASASLEYTSDKEFNLNTLEFEHKKVITEVLPSNSVVAEVSTTSSVIPKTLSNKCDIAEYRGIVSKYFPENQVENALTIMKAESGCNASAISPTADYGLMQINKVHRAKVGGDLKLLLDPETNIRVASQIFYDSGWNPWSTAKKLGLAI